MREIKFRAWDGQRMLVGVTPIWYVSEIDGKYKLVYGRAVQIMQYTGLLDKNDKEIYEGDVLLFLPTKENYTMGFREGSFDLIDFDNYGHDQCRAFEDENDWEVIGNIYENPELVK
jgi:uncharacterized phage protein (TIGR01671 family)